MQLEPIRALVADDMAAVDQVIRDRLASEVALIDQVSSYIIGAGGKRLRPILLLLAAGASGCTDQRRIEAAAIVEFIHTATLLHDDVVDESHLRRGEPTANDRWGNQAAVLVGDFLYSRAFQMMVDVGEMDVMSILADATNTIAEGEVLQLINCGDPDTTEERYLQVIRRKTARLFEAGAEIAAVLGGRPRSEREALAAFGSHLGTAFQLVDDVLDYTADATDLGKNLGDDLSEGKPTLPLIHAIREGSPEAADAVREAIRDGGTEQLQHVLEAIESTGAIHYTSALARAEVDRARAALSVVPDSEFRRALEDLADFSVARTS